MNILPIVLVATLFVPAPADQAAPSATPIELPPATPPAAAVPTPAPAMIPTPMVFPTASPAPEETAAPTPRPETPAPKIAARPSLADLISHTPHLNQVLAPDRTVDLFYLRLGTEKSGIEGYVPAGDPQIGMLKTGQTIAIVRLGASGITGATHALVWASTNGGPYRYAGTIPAAAGHMTVDLKHGYIDVLAGAKLIQRYALAGSKLIIVNHD